MDADDVPTANKTYDVVNVTLRAPVEWPSNLIGISLNRAEHATKGRFYISEDRCASRSRHPASPIPAIGLFATNWLRTSTTIASSLSSLVITYVQSTPTESEDLWVHRGEQRDRTGPQSRDIDEALP